VHRDEAGGRRRLRERRDELTTRLEAVRGRSEWVVTLQRDEPSARAAAEAVDPELAQLNEEIARAQPGRAYLLKRQLEGARRDALGRLDREAVGGVLASLAEQVERVESEPIVQVTADAPLA